MGKGHLATPGLSTAILPTNMIRFITFLALVLGGIGVVAAGVLAGLRVDLRSVGVDAFQRRQTTGQVPPQCESLCNPINAMLAAVSDMIHLVQR